MEVLITVNGGKVNDTARVSTPVQLVPCTVANGTTTINTDLERIRGQTAKHIKGPLKRARCMVLES